jgi:hypothetical protein
MALWSPSSAQTVFRCLNKSPPKVGSKCARAPAPLRLDCRLDCWPCVLWPKEPLGRRRPIERVRERIRTEGERRLWSRSGAMASNSVLRWRNRRTCTASTKNSTRAQDEDKPERHQQHAEPGCRPPGPGVACLGAGNGDRGCPRLGGSNRVAGSWRCGRNHLHVDYAWRGMVGRELIRRGIGNDGCRRHGRSAPRNGDGIGYLDLGRRRRRRLGRGLRCGA